MLVFNIHDDRGERFAKDDFDVLLLAGRKYQPQSLPGGFFQDRQMNRLTSNLVYYLNANKMELIRDDFFGMRIVARPTGGFSHYAAAEFRSDGIDVQNILGPNQTTYVDVMLRRIVDKNVFRFDRADQQNASPSAESSGSMSASEISTTRSTSSSPWQKGLFVNRGSCVRIDLSPVSPTTNPAHLGPPGPRIASHARRARPGG